MWNARSDAPWRGYRLSSLKLGGDIDSDFFWHLRFCIAVKWVLVISLNQTISVPTGVQNPTLKQVGGLLDTWGKETGQRRAQYHINRLDDLSVQSQTETLYNGWKEQTWKQLSKAWTTTTTAEVIFRIWVLRQQEIPCRSDPERGRKVIGTMNEVSLKTLLCRLLLLTLTNEPVRMGWTQKTGIGGSDAGAIVGVNKYVTPPSL